MVESEKIEEAPLKYARHLEGLIRAAIKEGKEKAIVNARAIVAARNDMRRSLISVSSLLNTEIDLLASQLGERAERSVPSRGKTDSKTESNSTEVYETIEVLWKKWPIKEDQIVVEMTKLLVELGLLRKK